MGHHASILSVDVKAKYPDKIIRSSFKHATRGYAKQNRQGKIDRITYKFEVRRVHPIIFIAEIRHTGCSDIRSLTVSVIRSKPGAAAQKKF